MRPLVHPALEEITVEGILHALSDPVRVAIWADILRSQSSFNCTRFAGIVGKPIPKSTLSQHFKVLREAGLIRGERHGVEMQNVSRCTEINQRFPGLVEAIVDAHSLQLADKAAREAKSARRGSTSRVASPSKVAKASRVAKKTGRPRRHADSGKA